MVSVLYKLLESILYFFGKLYIPIYWFIKLCCGFSAKIWIRNSVYFGNQIFFISDIDLTIVETDPNKIINRVHLLRKFLLMIGELNVYRTSYLPYISEFMNQCELSRDPKLGALVSKQKNIVCSDAIVFLLRAYQSDLNNLKERPWLRIRKWNSHIDYIKSYFPDVNGKSAFEVITELSDGKLNCETIILENKTLFPHLWFSTHYCEKELLSLGEVGLGGTQLMKEIFHKQLAWEFTGVMSQIDVIKNNEQIRSHFMNIVTILSEHKDSYSVKLKESIISFCKNELVTP